VVERSVVGAVDVRGNDVADLYGYCGSGEVSMVDKMEMVELVKTRWWRRGR